MSDSLVFTPLDESLSPFRCDPAWAEETQKSVSDHLEALRGPGESAVHTASGEKFCGCLTCITREALYHLIPRILDGAAAGLVERA